MPIQIKSVKGYYCPDVWIMANIIQQSTLQFCRDLLNRDNDPCGRLRDQMTMAARSGVVNIAEGTSRRQNAFTNAFARRMLSRLNVLFLHGKDG